jgi:N-acetylglucosaminyl-diphospho-decaprenol L-rhamnosyltransferase
MDYILKIKFVIVDYFKGELVKNLIEKLTAISEIDFDICVIDNSCSDVNFSYYDELSSLNNVSIFKSTENLGYSKACNLGAQGAWDYVFFLNPDIDIYNADCITRIIKVFSEDTKVGCVGICQKNPNGTFEPVARKFPNLFSILANRIKLFRVIFYRSLNRYLYSFNNNFDSLEGFIEVDWLQSSFLCVSKECWHSVKGFDERFFVFMADVDFGKKCKMNSYMSVLLRSSYVLADGVRNSRGGFFNIFSSKSLRIHILDAFKYYLKWIF